MKRVLIVNTKYKEVGGEDSNIIDEINFLSKFYEVSYLEFDNGKSLDIWDLISFTTTSNLKSNKLLKNKLNSFKPDIVYIHNTWFKAGLGLIKILNKNKINTVYKIHNFRYYCAASFLSKRHLRGEDFCPACGMEVKDNRWFNKYFKESTLKSIILIRFTKKLINILRSKNLKILTITEFHKEFLINIGINPKNIVLYNNPIKISNKIPSQYNPESNYVLYAGRLTKSKGVVDLLETWSKYSNKDIEMKIIGTGDLEDKLVNKYSSNNVSFLGYLENKEVLDLISKSKAVVTTTRMFEGQPRLLCEAASLGVPSIFPDTGGISEFFPKDYPLSFKQFKYDDLLLKFQQLENTDILNHSSASTLTHIVQKLDEKKLELIFNKLIRNRE